ncbi:MAG: protein translocase subunit SecD, partial [Myxococcota bacterium]|nr:protein translocase subunit SecD [Myxococcota bacterium]
MSLRWRAIAVAVLVGLFAWLTAANFVDKEDRIASDILPNDLLRMGLDLQGGMHWVVGVRIERAVEREIGVLAGNLTQVFAEEEIATATAVADGTTLRVSVVNTLDRTRVDEVLVDYTALQELSSTETSIELELVPGRVDEVRELTMSQVLEVLRRRIDDPQTGIPESVVTRQGDSRVLVQIPGGQVDRDIALNLLSSTAFLEFKIVEDRDQTDELLLARHPDLRVVAGQERSDELQLEAANGEPASLVLVHEVDPETKASIGSFLVAKEAPVTGQYLTNAQVGFDQRQRPEVEFTFSDEGGQLFGELSGNNIDRLLAIILDGRVYSAPVLQSRITTRGRITGRFTSPEAANLAVILRAGSLAVPVEIMEERTVGPALGQDSIDSGLMASAVGLGVILLFVVFYYRLSGVYASIALATNLVLLIGLMSFFEATLTLPGIAGLVLTIGMAVDANVIIFEWIREELREGRTTRASIATGFNTALWTVLDANITTLITGIILFQFGTGPIKGFAVTLCVGILTSVFSALVV